MLLHATDRHRLILCPLQVNRLPWHARGLLLQRMQVRDPHRQMPPLGTRSVDAQGLALLTRWISALPPEKDPTK